MLTLHHTAILIFSQQNVNKDNLVNTLEIWIKKHPDPDKKLFFSGGESLSPREIFEEVKEGTKKGKEFRKAILMTALRFIEKAKT